MTLIGELCDRWHLDPDQAYALDARCLGWLEAEGKLTVDQ